MRYYSVKWSKILEEMLVLENIWISSNHEDKKENSSEQTYFLLLGF